MAGQVQPGRLSIKRAIPHCVSPTCEVADMSLQLACLVAIAGVCAAWNPVYVLGQVGQRTVAILLIPLF